MTNPFYVCEGYYLLIHETQETLKEAVVRSATSAFYAQDEARYCSEQYKTKVTFSYPNELIMVLSKNGVYWNVIIGERVGWIACSSWINIHPLKNYNSESK